ncbi:AvrPphF family type III effector [Pseudomonas amygdali]|uniref:AvrPphF family type III effector n=1 Tax=Pseudomonas amygdali TaxID=47877 RepID=UPI001FB64A09|nr:AvrPphF family type III effector [Pseudomonas amygdali]
MGNICGTSSSHYVYSPPVSPRHVSGSSTPVHSVGGQGLTSVYQLSAEARDDFLDRFDPMRNLGLNSETPLYRTTDTSWRNVIAQVRNPDEDPRIDHLLTMAEEIYKASSTFRKRMNAVAGEGGVTIRIVPDSEIGHSFGHAATRPATRSVALTETTASNVQGSHYQSLNILLVELSNLSRANKIAEIRSSFQQGRIGQRRAAHNVERAEYGTIADMVKYFTEARPVIESLGYGNPSMWYAAHDYGGRIVPAYRSFEDYYATALSSGHTDVHLNNYSRSDE